MFYDVKRQSINEQECAALERCVNSIFYFHKNSINAIPKYEHIIAPHVSSTSTFIKIADSVVMIWSKVMGNVRCFGETVML